MNTTARGLTRVAFSLLAAGLAATMVASPAFAAKGGTPGAPEKPGETSGNNLSVPAIFVPDTIGAPALRLPCAEEPVAPGWDDSPTSVVYPGYWLQKTSATWSASCETATTASVVADWGDNLTNEEVGIKAGKTIRVEMGLLGPTAAPDDGFAVDKLDPDLLDRLSNYGTKGDPLAAGTATRIWDAGAHLTITHADGTPVYDGPATAEINSMGAVVYGYNWGQKGAPPAAGDYVIIFTVSNGTTITGVDDGDYPHTEHTATLYLELLPKSGGGGNNGNHGNPNK